MCVLLSECNISSLHALPAQRTAPTITAHPADIIVVEGTAVSLSCSANGEPPALISWQLDGNRVALSSLVTVTSSGDTSELRVSRVRTENLGFYRCSASNSEGIANSNLAELQIASV